MTRPSLWNLLRPKWLLLLGATVAACITMVLLGRWQWHSGRRSGDLTNYSYAFQWWAFTVFAIVMFARLVRDLVRSPAPVVVDVQSAEPAPAAYLAYVAPPSVAQDDDDDPERARFNQYLASLSDSHPPVKEQVP